MTDIYIYEDFIKLFFFFFPTTERTFFARIFSVRKLKNLIESNIFVEKLKDRLLDRNEFVES